MLYPLRLPLIILIAIHASIAVAQPSRSATAPLAANVIIPQRLVLNSTSASPVTITKVVAGTVIVEQVATTTLDIALQNPGASPTEAELVVPVPPGAVIRTFAFDGPAAAPTATVLPADRATSLYNTIVAKARDPALLEFVGSGAIRSSVFPIAAGGAQKVRLTYEQVLPRDGRRIDYELPRSESLAYSVPWEIAVKVKSKAPIATVYSPSHAVDTLRSAPGELSVRTTAASGSVPGPFRLSYLLADDAVSASLLACPDLDADSGAGYFLLLVGLPPKTGAAAPTMRRELTLVIDRSGSMADGKLDQARAAALQVLAGLNEGETFNLIAYNNDVTAFAPAPVRKDAETLAAATQFLRQLNAAGGTNLHAALAEALRPAPAPEQLPLVLFLTDGLPTVGVTSELEIRKLATDQNPFRRRVFTFGVGYDVNTPLLTGIANESRGEATFVLPNEDVEVKIAGVFKNLKGPLFTDLALSAVGNTGGLPRVSDVLPSRLPDLFEDDQLVVLGRYRGAQPLDFELRGTYRGRQRTFKLHFALDGATTRNAFVPRLWASRQIGVLADSIRQLGADPDVLAATPALASADPRLKELTDEIVRLSTEFGVLTEYTAFLAREGTNLARKDEVLAEAIGNFKRRAIAVRSGKGAMNQAYNGIAQQQQQVLNYDNNYLDENMNRVSTAAIQQVNDLAFFRRGERWIDSRLATTAEAAPDRVVEWGTPAFHALVDRLSGQHRSGALALTGEILLRVGQERVLIRGPVSP